MKMFKAKKNPNIAASVDRYCDIAGFSEKAPVMYAYDASDCTLIEIEGVKSILSPEEFEANIQEHFVAGVAQLLKRAGHALSISYESSSNIDDDLETLVSVQHRNADLKNLDIAAIAGEQADIIREVARRERVLMAIWTMPKAALKSDVAVEQAEQAEAFTSLPPASNAQPPKLGLKALEGPHRSSVMRVVDALESANLRVRILGPDEHGRREDLAEIRKAVLYHETPENWSPFGPSERTYPGAKAEVNSDTSEFFSPPVAQQILSSGAVASSNLRTIAMGGRTYAVVAVSVFPKTIEHFNVLIDSLNSSRTNGTPFRVCFHFEDIEAGAFGIRKVLAGLASWTNPATKNLFMALKDLQKIHEQDKDTVCKARVIATTWIEPGEPVELLEQRRSFLVRSIMSWGEAQVMEAPHNPMRALAETVPGMNMRAVIPSASLAPLSHVAAMLPFHRAARVFQRGETVFLSPDNRLMPHEAFSSDQNFWLTLIYATPGSGKSVLLNRANYDFTCYSPGKRLPFVCVIDVGVSSEGYIDVVRNALPEGRAHEALYVRLQNTQEHAINPFDLGPGRRMPLMREKVFVENFLLTLFNLRGAGAEGLADKLVNRVVDRLYRSKSDLEFTNTAARWQPGMDPALDDMAREAGIPLNPRTTTWWAISDGFTIRRKYLLAQRAQRYATPRLEDLSTILNEPILQDDFPALLLQIAQRSIESAVGRYPIFATTTRLDVGEARVLSIDLQDVVQRFKSDESERNNSLFFMAARQVFLSKIGGHADEIRAMELPSGEARAAYVEYWTQRYADIAETNKRLAMDEYHLTGGTEGIAKQVLADAREGRKWGLEIILASQLLQDFEKMKDMASTVMILNADSAQLRTEAQQVFGFSDAVMRALKRHVHGPKAGKGATFLTRYTLREQERWVLQTNRAGPRLLWALTTKKEDRLIRNELYQRVSVNEALRILAQRYPAGSAIEHWKRIESQATDKDSQVAKLVVDQIMGEVTARQGISAMAENYSADANTRHSSH